MNNENGSIPPIIHTHLQQLIESADMPSGDEFFNEIVENWLSKNTMFNEQTRSLDMIECDNLPLDDERGAIICTYSGSLISLGSLDKDSRWLEYTSIKLRNDVPDIIKINNAKILEDIIPGKPILLDHTHFKSTSPVLTIAQCKQDVSLAEQEKRIREATIFLTNGFMKLNNTLSIYNEDIDHFNMKSIIRYLSQKNDLTQSITRQLIDDYVHILESGVLLGEKVPLGNLGKISLKVKEAQKARIGRNPATGEEITIKAKPAVYIPKASFSKYFKEKAASIDVE